MPSACSTSTPDHELFLCVCSLGCPEVGHSKLIFTAHFFCVSSGPVIVVAVIGVAFLFLCDAALRRGPRRNWGPPAQKREIGRNSSAGRRGVSLAILWKKFKTCGRFIGGKKKELNFIDLYSAASTGRRHQVRCCLEHEKKIELRSALTLPSLKVEMILKNARCKTELCGFPSRQWAPKKVNPQTIGRGAVTFHRWLSSGPMI